jgi:hypothetical protein
MRARGTFSGEPETTGYNGNPAAGGGRRTRYPQPSKSPEVGATMMFKLAQSERLEVPT